MSDKRLDISRRKILGGLGTIGAAGALGGAATTSLLWDEEKFGNANDPNYLQGGELDLKVDWEGTYYDWIDNPTISSDTDGDGEPDLVDQPGPIVQLEDVKPGDVMELTVSLHVFGNPAFVGGFYEEFSDTDETIPEPEDKVNGHVPDGSDGTDDGDLDDYTQVVVWYDDGDNLIDELLDGVDDDDDGEIDGSEEDYVMRIADIQDAGAEFGDHEDVAFAGTLEELDALDDMMDDIQFKASKSNSTDTNTPNDGTDTDDNLVAEDFSDWCYEASATEYIGIIAWVPRDIEGVNDNIIQTDRLEFQFGFNAVQCRHNVANDGGPMDENGDDDNGDIPPQEEPPDLTVDGEQAISWISICCGDGLDPGPVSDYITCVTLDEDNEVDKVGLSGLDTNQCDVYFFAGNQVFQTNDGAYVPPAPVSPSNYCGQPNNGSGDDDAVGSKMDGEDIVDLKQEEDLPDCPEE